MNNQRRDWWWTWGLVMLLTTVGCGTGKSEKKMSDAPMTSPVSSMIPPTPSTDSGMPHPEIKEQTLTKMTMTTGEYFVANKNIQPVYFDLSKSQLSDPAQETLKKNAEWLKQNPPMLVQITGYADSRGSLKRNLTLAERRALRVKEFYVSEGIPAERILLVSLGTEEPTCAEVSEACLAKSRRVETLVESKPLVSR